MFPSEPAEALGRSPGWMLPVQRDPASQPITPRFPAMEESGIWGRSGLKVQRGGQASAGDGNDEDLQT